MTAETPLDAALDYARRGWRVVPIKPGEKRPAIDAWTERATTDEALIHEWWERWPNHGVGIATGPASGFWVLDVDTGPGKWGDDTLADLEATYGELPPTVEVVTGSGGRHLYFLWPEDQEIRNDQAGRLGLGLDVRGEGGQVLAPPTIHPTGTRYEWEASGDPEETPIADAPPWLIELLARPAQAERARRERAPKRDDHDSLPGTWFAQQVTWPQLLEADRATYLETRTERETGEAYELWSRPPMIHEEGFTAHTSATLYYKGSDVLKVFTPNWRGVDPETGAIWSLDTDATYTRFGYYAARHHGGDHDAAAVACARMRREAGEEPAVDDFVSPELLAEGSRVLEAAEEAPPSGDHGWEPTDLSAIMAGNYEPPRPTLLSVDGSSPLLYPGRVNSIHGESGGGKSWLALAATAQELFAGHTVIYVDLEDHAAAVIGRLSALGVPSAAILDSFVYISPEFRWTDDAGAEMARLIEQHDVTLAVIDSTGEAMALDGAKPNNDDETALWFRRVPRFIARRGPAVLMVDHVPKDPETGRMYAIGSQRKRAAVTGAAYALEVRVAPARDKEGHLRLVCAKDRFGHHQAGATVADVTITPSDGGQSVAIQIARHERVKRPTVLMERVSIFLEQNGPASQNAIIKNVRGKDPVIREAVKIMAEEGLIELATGGWVSRSPFRESDPAEWIADISVDKSADPASSVSPASPPRPPRVPADGDTPKEGASPASPAFSKRTPGGDAPTELAEGRGSSGPELSTTEPGSLLI